MGMHTRWTLCYYPDNTRPFSWQKRYVERTAWKLMEVLMNDLKQFLDLIDTTRESRRGHYQLV